MDSRGARFLLLFLISSIMALSTEVWACEACQWSRLTFFHPERDVWVIGTSVWIFLQVVYLSIWREWRIRTVVILALLVVWCVGIMRFLFLYPWPYFLMDLWIFPTLCMVGLVFRYYRRRELSRYMIATWATGIIALVALFGAKAYILHQVNQKPMIDRIFEHGYRAATRNVLLGIGPDHPEAFTIRREILKRGDLRKTSSGIVVGEDMMMGDVSKFLLANGDPAEQLPLIFDSWERMNARYAELGMDQDSHILGAVARFFNEPEYQGYAQGWELEDYRDAWAAYLADQNQPTTIGTNLVPP